MTGQQLFRWLQPRGIFLIHDLVNRCTDSGTYFPSYLPLGRSSETLRKTAVRPCRQKLQGKGRNVRNVRLQLFLREGDHQFLAGAPEGEAAREPTYCSRCDRIEMLEEVKREAGRRVPEGKNYWSFPEAKCDPALLRQSMDRIDGLNVVPELAQYCNNAKSHREDRSGADADRLRLPRPALPSNRLRVFSSLQSCTSYGHKQHRASLIQSLRTALPAALWSQLCLPPY